MKNKVISDKQAILLIAVYLIGESSILVMGLEAKKDLWIAIIIGIFIACLLMIVYSRLHYLFPGKNLFDIIEVCCGPFIGKGIILLFTIYMFDLSAIVLRDFGNFISTVSLDETPILIPMIVETLLVVFLVKNGVELAGKWAEFFFPILVFFILIIVLLLIPTMDINNIRPVLYNGIKPSIKGAFAVFSIPLAEIIAFTMVFSNFKTKKSSYKIYFLGLLIGGMLIFIISLTNILVLGVDLTSVLYFPSYNTTTRLNIGGAFQRLEVISAVVFVLGGFIKISILLLSACKGITKIFGYTDYRFIVIPFALLMINLSYFEFDSVTYYREWNMDIYPYYALPFQVILPIIILIIAEIKKKQLLNIK
ncbi:spore germination protein GerKB [Clostridium sediminicola]|uniref:GerAB/ArcD/ProY family transporter n=1 Tax=Clostridium sediminicola TaxID=3114879 RepID=UPI0031F244A3